MGKLLLLTLNGQEEKAIDKIIAALSGYIELDNVQIAPFLYCLFRDWK